MGKRPVPYDSTAQHSTSQHYSFIVYISRSYSYSTRKETGRRAGMLATLLTGLISVLCAVTPGVTLDRMAALTRRFRIWPGFYRDDRWYHVESRIDSSPGRGLDIMPSQKATGCRPDKKAPATDETAPPSVTFAQSGPSYQHHQGDSVLLLRIQQDKFPAYWYRSVGRHGKAA